MGRVRLHAYRMIGLAAAAAAGAVLASPPAHAVVGGSPAGDDAYRYTVKLDVNGTRSCTGALVDPRWVITATNCFSANNQPVVAGPPPQSTTVTVSRTDLSAATTRTIKVVDLEPRSDRNVVLARLASAVLTISTIPLSTSTPGVGETLRVAGYGRTASDWVPDRPNTALINVGAVTATTFTIDTTTSGAVNTCMGDAGGPDIRETHGTAELVGVHNASWQNGCDGAPPTARAGTTETRTDDIAAWIRQTVTAPISLYATVNSRYVTADQGGAQPLIANRTAVGPWEQFDQVDAGDGYVALRAKANSMYVTADQGGAASLIANRTVIGPWEQFKIVPNSDGTISLLAHANGLYVTADNGGAAPLVANRTVIGPWEEFLLT